MFIWIVGFVALSLITAVFSFTGIETPSTDAAVFLFQIFSLAAISLVAWALIHRHQTIIGHDLHRHY